MKQPPTLATSLLTRLGGLNLAGVGDVLEQFQAGKSSFWYWRQVIGLIANAAFRDLRRNPALGLGVLAGGIAFSLLTPFVFLTISTLDQLLFERGFRWFYLNGYTLPSVFRHHPWSIVAVFYPATAWVIGRFAGQRQAAVALMFASSIFAWGLMSLLVQIRVSMTPLSFELAFRPLPLGLILTQKFMVDGKPEFMNPFLFHVAILPLLTLIGGLSARRRDPRAVVA